MFVSEGIERVGDKKLYWCNVSDNRSSIHVKSYGTTKAKARDRADYKYKESTAK
jgi:hypothetical protein